MRTILRVLFRTNAIDDRVRRTLVDTLYTQPESLAIGGLCGITTSAAAAYYSENPAITDAAIILSVIAVARAVVAFAVPLYKNRNARALEVLFEMGAFSYAFMVGLVAALTVHLNSPVEVQMLTVSNAIAYGVGIAARNAGQIPNGEAAYRADPTVQTGTAYALSRDAVKAEVVAANARGELNAFNGEASYERPQVSTSARSREDVRNETIAYLRSQHRSTN